MTTELREKIRALGLELTPPLLEGTHALFKGLHAESTPPTADVRRDLRYGPNERNRLERLQAGGPRSR